MAQGLHRSFKPGKSWNLKIWIPGLESPGIFVEVLESPGIWNSVITLLLKYGCIFKGALKICEFIEKVLEFDIGWSWKVLESEMSKCV